LDDFVQSIETKIYACFLWGQECTPINVEDIHSPYTPIAYARNQVESKFDAYSHFKNNRLDGFCGGGHSWMQFYNHRDSRITLVHEVLIPAALPLFAVGLSAMGLMSRRRKWKAAVTA
jgi:hypothetical protein